jgi:dihydrofolate reductase
MHDFLERIDSIFFGRKSYDVLVNSGEDLFWGKKKYVFSQSLPENEDYELIHGDMETEVKNLKQREGQDIWLFGGAILVNYLLNLGLVDEMILSIHPILLGKGKRLFQNLPGKSNLHLYNSVTYDSGLVQLYYNMTNK